jgi:hypothetical protein
MASMRGGVACAAFEAVARRGEQVPPNHSAQPVELDLDDQLVLEVCSRRRSTMTRRSSVPCVWPKFVITIGWRGSGCART